MSLTKNTVYAKVLCGTLPTICFTGGGQAIMSKRSQNKKCQEPSPAAITFSLDQKQAVELARWLKTHHKKCPYAKRENQGAAGGGLWYIFGPTDLGVAVKVRCACGEEVDLVDHDW